MTIPLRPERLQGKNRIYIFCELAECTVFIFLHDKQEYSMVCWILRQITKLKLWSTDTTLVLRTLHFTKFDAGNQPAQIFWMLSYLSDVHRWQYCWWHWCVIHVSGSYKYTPSTDTTAFWGTHFLIQSWSKKSHPATCYQKTLILQILPYSKLHKNAAGPVLLAMS